jgi:hypothetical protein
MQLNSFTVEAKDLTASAVTLVFRVNAKLQATDESNVRWGLYVTVSGLGVQRFPDVPVPLPVGKTDTRFVGGNQTPKGLTQGDDWTPTFEGSYQRNDISVPERDIYIIGAKLVPIFDINESETRTTTLGIDI